MRSFIAFTKKEILEMTRTYKFFILIIAFLILGFMNPITAKMTPDLLKNLMPVEGMVIPESTIYDSWAQFFKNVPQLGLVLIVILFSGRISSEISGGTLISLLTKGLSRKNVILSKTLITSGTWTICYFVAFGVTLSYSALLWNETSVSNLGMAVLTSWIFGLLILSSLILGGVISRYAYGSLLTTGVLMVIMIIANMIKATSKLNPLQLVSRNMEIVEGSANMKDIYGALLISIGLAIVFIGFSVVIFNRKNIQE